MQLTKSLRKLLFQNVHCTGYLSKTKGNYYLEYNHYDNKWYYKSKEKYVGIPSDDFSTWKHNRKFELKETNFTGVIVKFENILISTMLGTYKHESSNGTIYSCSFSPAKSNGCKIIAATVFFRNGCKRFVPLDCIKESDEFSNGNQTKQLMNKLKQVIDDDISTTADSKNEITFEENGIIKIENSYCRMDLESENVLHLKRFLFLDIRNRKADCYSEAENEWFDITNEEYNKIMDRMNNQMLEECGFVPDLSYGETNFARLVNFARFPFAPVLNELCCKEILGPTSEKAITELKNSPDCVKRFIPLTGLLYTPKNNKIFLRGHRDFTEYLAIMRMGFKDEDLIETLSTLDYMKLFEASLFVPDENSLKNDVEFLLDLYDEKTVTKLIGNYVSEREFYTTDDCLQYMKLIASFAELPQRVIDKVGKEGFTDYNHNLLMRMWNDLPAFDDEENEFMDYLENIGISYSDEEKALEWVNSGYQFCLPEDTNRLNEIGWNMNICVGHLYRDKAVNKESTIIYVQKDDEYVLCIEIQKHNNRFRLVQHSAFNNSVPKGDDLIIIKKWCRVKGVSYA